MTEEYKSNILPDQRRQEEDHCDQLRDSSERSEGEVSGERPKEFAGKLNDIVDCFKGVSFTGQVKWFNTKAGYGFITVRGNNAKYLERSQKTDENNVDILCDQLNEKDIFVHYTAINVVNTQYKYLIQGEYVEFNIIKTNNDKYEYHSSNVHGINGGTIMCENRNTNVSSYNKRHGNTGRDVTYVGNDGVRHYSKVYRPRNNGQSNDRNENGDGRKRETVPSKAYENEYSKPVFNVTIHNPAESGGQDFKEVARGRNKRRQILATKV
jgi:cold shock CspA family protein